MSKLERDLNAAVDAVGEAEEHVREDGEMSEEDRADIQATLNSVRALLGDIAETFDIPLLDSAPPSTATPL